MRALCVSVWMVSIALTFAARGDGDMSPLWNAADEQFSPSAPDTNPIVAERTEGTIPCIHSAACRFFKDKLLVVKLNPVRLHWLDFLQRFYGAGMPNIVFYSSLRRGSPHDGGGQYLRIGHFKTTVTLLEDNYGFCDHYAVASAMRRFHGRFTGYIFLSDDVLLQFWRLVNYDTTRVWRQRPVYGEKAAGIAMGAELKAALKELQSLAIPGAVAVNIAAPPFASTSGVYFVPATFSEVFIATSEVLLKHRTYNEYGTPIVLHAVGGSNFITMPGALVWGKKRLRVRRILSSADVWQHPVRATGELFARATIFVYQAKTLDVREPLTEAMFDRECLNCASYPETGRKMKGVYHSCVIAESDSECATTPAKTVAMEWPELKSPDQCGGRVVVPPQRHHVKCPYELQHEGFWGKSITNFIFEEHYPTLNRTRLTSTFLGPYPACCVSSRAP